MPQLEETIKTAARGLGVQVVGLAGPERLQSGPPSIDLNYSLPGARSFISLVLPMDRSAIYQFLSKATPAPHNLDQYRSYQKLFHIGHKLAEIIRNKGYEAKALPLSADYRRDLYVFNPRPAFSLRLGAIAAGVAAFGWSGNVMTREYGAAIYLGGVATTAVLQSDPLLPADYFLKNFCDRCRRCARACPARMFASKTPDYLLFNRELHQRARHRNIDLCHTSCFGLHSLSRDKKFTNWGLHWITDWVEHEPSPEKKYALRKDMFKRGLTTGDSEPRFDVLRRLCSLLWPEKIFADIPEVKDFPDNEAEGIAILAELLHRIGVRGIDDYPISVMCGHCAIICGPDLEETRQRFRTLMQSGLVVPGPGGKMVRAATFAEAQNIRRRYPLQIPFSRKLRDAVRTIILWHRHYFGYEWRSRRRHRIYRQKLQKAIKTAART